MYRPTCFVVPKEILDDLLTKFLSIESTNLIRVCFQIELAHWFYLDNYVKRQRRLQSCNLHVFAAQVFRTVPLLREHAHNLDDIIVEWKKFKFSIPTYGAIILSEDTTHVLLVQSYGGRNSWGFPKGKINEKEEPTQCAVREVLEETGFDISNRVDANEFLQFIIKGQQVRLYIIKNVPMSTKFCPMTRNEIRSCQWFPVSDLPRSSWDRYSRIKISPTYFPWVGPFFERIRPCPRDFPKRPTNPPRKTDRN